MCAQRARPSSPGREPKLFRDHIATSELPQPLTSFVGRAEHIEEVSARLRRADVRLLTLAGPAGVGKSRLALAAAALVDADFPDGIHYVPCASLRDADELPATIAQILSIHAASADTVESSVITFARERCMLLVLDNLEQILPLPFVTRILTACHLVKVLTTSRTILHLSGEHEYVVPPMELPDTGRNLPLEELASVESMALLVNRAQQVNSGFAITNENAGDLAAICVRLDGLPLAIELAAARMKVFSPAALLDRLSDRLSLLIGGPSDQPPHQRTIRDTIGWSHDLLSGREQRVFRRLAVFTGGISPDAAALVCRDDDAQELDPDAEIAALNELTLLSDQSLLQQEKEPRDGPRFFLLETVRHFALDQLQCMGDETAIRQRHAGYYLELVEHAHDMIIAPDQSRWIQRIERDQSNIRDALQTLREANDAERYTRLACAMFRFWRVRGKLIEGRSWLEPALDDAWEERIPAHLRSRAFTNAGWLAWEQGDASHAESSGDEALSIATRIQHDSGMAHAYGLLSTIDNRLGNNTRAMVRMELSLKHHQLAGDQDSIAGSLNNLALLAMESGDFERAAALCAESRDSFTNLGNLYGASHAIDNRGVALYCLGAFEEAMRCSRESLASGRMLDDKRCIAISLDHVGKCARALGDLEAAWEAHAESLPYRQDLGDPRGLLTWLEAMALWMVQAGRPDLATRTLGAVEVVRIGSNIPLQRHEQGDHDDTVRLARDQLGDSAFDTLFAKGRWQSIDETVADMRDTAIQRVAELTQNTTPDLSTVTAKFGLTPREADVLSLIAKRYTDREIARALFISHRTVARHVTGLFTKLDVHSRREAAAMVSDLSSFPPPGQPTA